MSESLADSPANVVALAGLLVEATAHGASVGFLHPLDPAKAAVFWRHSLAEGAAGRRIVLGARDGAVLVGTVTVVLAAPENQRHRADVQKLLVAVSHRRRGIGRRLMAEAEARAARAGRSLLVLDTATDAAARLYERTGWNLTGAIPGYALLPNGAPCATSIYWKNV
ncbi:MAG: GNAT family N-acetyltransferase [Myxococcota bacterium]